METYSPNEGVRPEIPKEGIGSSAYCETAKEMFAEMKPSVTREEAITLLGLRDKGMSLEEVNEAIESLRKEQVDLQKRISKLYEQKWKHERLDELCEVDLLLDRSSPL